MTSTLTDDDWCEINSKAINRMYETLTRDIDCTKYFPSLRSAFILTADDCDEIRHEGTRKKMVMKFLDLLDRNKKPTVVEELLKAIRKDKTMPQLHTKLVRTFVDTKEQYKRETNKQEATPPQQRRENGRSSTSGTDTNEVGPVPPAPNSVAPSSHSPDSLPSPSRYCIHTDPMNSTTTNPSIHQQVGIASMSSSSSNFSSCRIPGPPPTSHTRKTASASALSSTNSSDPIPLPPQVQNCAGRGGPVTVNPGVSKTSDPRSDFNPSHVTDEETEAANISTGSDVFPSSDPPALTEPSSASSSCPPTMDDVTMNGPKSKAPCSQSVLDFSHTAQQGSPLHSGKGTDSSNNGMKSIAPTSGDDAPSWFDSHRNNAFS